MRILRKSVSIESLFSNIKLEDFRNNSEDIKLISVYSIESLFSDIKLYEKGTEEALTLPRRHPHNSEGENRNEKLIKVGPER